MFFGLYYNRIIDCYFNFSSFIIFKNINESNITERLGRLEVNLMKEMGDFKSDLSRSMNEDFSKIK